MSDVTFNYNREIGKKKKIIIENKTPNMMLVDGKKYVFEKQCVKKIDGVPHDDKVIFSEFDEDEYKADMAILVDTIAEHTAKKELIRELVKSVDYKTLRRLVKRIESGKVIKKVRGCIGFKMGDAYLQLID
jgi:uncharacterized protein (DUF1919 family)